MKRGLSCTLKRCLRQRTWLQCDSGVVALEFALLAPVVLIMLIGSFDVTRGLIAANRLSNAAQQVVEIATATAGQASYAASGTIPAHTMNVLTDSDVYNATTAPFAVLPDLASRVPVGNVASPPMNISTSFSITLSGVTFSGTPAGCTTNCTAYTTATVAWSVANSLGSPIKRMCGSIGQSQDTDPPALNTMPKGTYGPVTVLVADLSYTYTPLFSGYVIGPITLNRTAYLSARTGNTLQYTPGLKDPTHCPAS
jgi:Flp pilus assembly protein TadG